MDDNYDVMLLMLYFLLLFTIISLLALSISLSISLYLSLFLSFSSRGDRGKGRKKSVCSRKRKLHVE